MSLTGATYLARARTGIGQESYLVDIYDSDGFNSLLLGAQDVRWTAAPVITEYRGILLNAPTVREEIDLLKCTSSVGNVTLECANAMLGGALADPPRLLSDILLNGNDDGGKYITHKVVIYSWLGPVASDDNRLKIFEGRLVEVSPDGTGGVSLELEVKRPWDLISIPNVRTPEGGYFPVVYGDYTPNTSTPTSPGFCSSRALWPAKADSITNEVIYCPMPQAYSTDAVRAHFFESGMDRFVPLVDSAEAYLAATVTYGSGNAAPVDTQLIHAIRYKPSGLALNSAWPSTFTDPELSFDDPENTDGYSGTYATATVTTTAKEFYLQCAQADLDVYDTVNSAHQFTIYVPLNFSRGGAPMPTLWLSVDGGSSFISAYAASSSGNQLWQITIDETDLPGGVLPQQIGFYFFILGGSTACTVKIFDVRIEPIMRTSMLVSPMTASDQEKASNELRRRDQVKAVKEYYFGCDGLGASGGFQAAIADQVHEIHRDMLYRFAGMTATPDGWSATDTARANWDARVWLHEPVELIKVLEQLQYEGGFVFHVRPTGTGNYIAVKTSYAAGDVAATLDCQQDVGGLKVSHTHAKDLVTKYEVDFQRHPADESRYIQHMTASASARADFDFGSTENVKTEALDFLVTTDSGGAATVSAWTDYRELMAGNVTTLVSCTVLNPKYWYLEVGDIVKFSNASSVQDCFGNLTTAYYMVTKTQRTPGELGLSLREVG